MNAIELHSYLLNKILTRYKADILVTGNDRLNTQLFVTPMTYVFEGLELEDDEYPVIECLLDNGNHILATTARLLSRYNGNLYEMYYPDYKEEDQGYYNANKPFFEGSTKTFKYHKKSGGFILYEIDSIQPADAVHNLLRYYIDRIGVGIR